MYTTDVGFIPKKDVLDVQPPIRAGSTSPYYCSSFYRVQKEWKALEKEAGREVSQDEIENESFRRIREGRARV